MTFFFPQLDERTREHMLDEHALDDGADHVTVGRRLNQAGERVYRAALPAALGAGTPVSLQATLEPIPGKLWVPEIRNVRGHRSPTNRMAAQTLAEGEYNRYYMRAICRRALAEGNGTVRVIRGKVVDNPRPDRTVTVAVGDVLDAAEVLNDLRENPEGTQLGMPRGPNSGLTLEFLVVPEGKSDPR